MGFSLLTLAYLLASISFIAGLKMLSNPQTAKNGNLIAALGMGIAMVATIFLYEDEGKKLGNLTWIFAGLLLGGVVGWLMAVRVKMTAMPEMVSLFNGMGGACAALISLVELDHLTQRAPQGNLLPDLSLLDTGNFIGYEPPVGIGTYSIIAAGLVIGSVSFSGSLVAWGKLRGLTKDIRFVGQKWVNLLVLFLVLGLSFFAVFSLRPVGSEGVMQWPDGEAFAQGRILFYFILGTSLLYGILFVLPIGGADMPVVISLLNSFTGVAAAFGGFLYGNKAMLTGGILVGAAGTLLTVLMCRAMNRSLGNVLLGAFGAKSNEVSSSSTDQSYREVSVQDVSILLNYASRVMIVPGYGLAVAQAQHACHELEKLLTTRGVEVDYAIHPVAGRMPGHMNVLLAESDVPYEKLLEMEAANELFSKTDVVLVLGANDVVNPAAKSDPASPIFGMPILEVEEVRQVIINKRSMKPGYAGIENQLFFQPKSAMLFGDAKKVLQDLVAALKQM